MRISILFLFVGVLSISASVYSQDAKISIQEQDMSVNEVFAAIKKQTNYSFWFDVKEVDVERRVSLDVDNESVKSVLTRTLEDQDVFFALFGNHIIISKEDPYTTMAILQSITVAGTVTDVEGEPLPGVSVLIKGTTQGTATDVNGAFSLQIPNENAILEFSYIGFATQEITVGNRRTINITLNDDALQLDEVVVIGYGVAKRRDVTGSVSSLQAKEIAHANPVQPAQALQGQVSGVSINKRNSRPGSDYTIDIRGVHTFDYSNEPLVVIDGVMGGNLNTLNPSDIEAIDVLKDASATAIYGSRGGNGVIIVTTKKGKFGKPRVSYDGYAGVKTPTHLPNLMNAQQFYRAYEEVWKAERPEGYSPTTWTTTELRNVQQGKTVDWVKEVTAPSFQTSHAISLSGGNENTSNFFSASYLNEPGNLLNTGYVRYNLKASIDSELSKIVKVGITSYYTYSILNLGSNEVLRGAYRVRPTGSVYFDDLLNPTETNDRNIDGYAYWMGIKDTQVQNPILEVKPNAYKDETRVSNLLGNAYIELNPLKGLSFRSSLSASVFTSRKGVFVGADSKNRINQLPSANLENRINGSYTLDNILNYKKSIAKHDVNLTMAQSLFFERLENSMINVEDLPFDSDWHAVQTAAKINSPSSNMSTRALLSYMGRFNYTFNNKYLFTFTGRADRSSVLAPGNQWAFFPSVAIAWRAGDEDFIKNLNVFSDLKIRLSYGEVGNDVVAPYSTQALILRTAYNFGGTAAYGFAPRTLGNSKLEWERSSEYNLGFNMGFLQNRIYADVELYNKTTKSLIQRMKLPPSTGFLTTVDNVGKLRNSGVEISLRTVNVKNRDFNWTTSINFSANRNEILELYGGEITRDIDNRLFVGESIRSLYYYKFDGIWQLNEANEATKYNARPGEVKVVDKNNDGKISSNVDEDDRMVLGNSLPKWLAGMGNTFNYKNWDLSIFAYARIGVMFRNALLQGTMGELGSNRYNRLNLNYWTETNPTNDYFGVWQANPYREAIQYEYANFVRISNITLGYSLPQSLLSRMHFNNLRCYLQASNPFIFMKNKDHWMDPEFNSGTYQDDVPFATYMFGISMSF